MDGFFFCVLNLSPLVLDSIRFSKIPDTVLIPLYMFAEFGVTEEAIKRLSWIPWSELKSSVLLFSVLKQYSYFPHQLKCILHLEVTTFLINCISVTQRKKKILSGPHWKFNDVHNHLIMRKQVQVIIQVIMFQQLITSNICDNCKHRLITLLCFSHLKARFNTYIFILEHGCYRCTFLSSNRMYWDFA